MIKHAENVDRIKEARAVAAGEAVMIEIDYVTPGGITKTMRLPFRQASRVRGLIMDAIQTVPMDDRKRLMLASDQPT